VLLTLLAAGIEQFFSIQEINNKCNRPFCLFFADEIDKRNFN
jgi:hypothetical protein